MSRTYRFRLGFLVAALAVVAALTLWAVQQSWQRGNSLEKRLTTGNLESFRLADEFQRRLLDLNNTMLRYATRRDPAALEEFRQASEELNRWIDQHDPLLTQESKPTTKEERDFFPRLNKAYDGYLAAARSVFSNLPPAIVTATASTQLDHFEQQAKHLLNMGTQLAEVHRESQESFLDAAKRELAGLRALQMMSIVILVALVVVLGVVLYKDLVRPLRFRLVQSQALLERHEKLATLGTLAAGIAHEIRNPLTSIKARLYTLGKHIKGNPAGMGDASVINDEIARLERIVQDVLSFARPSEPRRRIVPAVAPLQEVHALMAGTLAARGVNLVIAPGADLCVSLDTALIKQVLINLVRNAADATERGGTVTLGVRKDQVALQGAPSAVAVLEVTDTGKGIPPEVEARLFDPFFTTKESGTGLGLSIAARIVEKHGGLLQYRTQVGHGTSFGIVLPSVSPKPDDESATRQDT